MKIIELLLSLAALIVSVVWFIYSGFDYEPLIVLIMGIAGLVHLFLTRDNIEPAIGNKVKNSQTVTVNISSPQETSLKPLIDTTEIEKSVKGVSRLVKIELMKPKLGVLFIDDDQNFKVVTILKDANWRKTKSIVDVKSLDMPVVMDAQIFFVDINGVGILLGCEHGGLDLAQMLKEKYPEKKVVIYSASKENNAFHPVWDICDFKLEKNALPYQFQKLVEDYSIELYNTNI